LHFDDLDLGALNLGSSASIALKKTLKQIVVNRWNFGSSIVYAAGYCIDPEFWDHDDKPSECTEALLQLGSKLLPPNLVCVCVCVCIYNFRKALTSFV
jgi:hypothetical protein